MRYQSVLLSITLIIAVLWLGCASPNDPGGGETEDDTIAAPIGVVGTPTTSPGVVFVNLRFKVDTTQDIDGRHVYRKVGDGDFVLMDTIAPLSVAYSPGPPGVGGTQCQDLWVVVDTSANRQIWYYMTSYNDSLESDPSDTVTFFPSDLWSIDSLTGLWPNQATDVTTAPSLLWDALYGAESYVVEVWKNGVQPRERWVYRHGSSGCPYHCDEGLVYEDALGEQLESGTEYAWTVWAIDANNMTIAMQSGVFTTAP